MSEDRWSSNVEAAAHYEAERGDALGGDAPTAKEAEADWLLDHGHSLHGQAVRADPNDPPRDIGALG